MPPSHLGVGLEATCDHPFPTSFWKRLSRLMSKVNPEPNVIHVMGCYVLGNPNGEKVQHPTSLQTPFPSQLSQRDPRAWPHHLGLLAPQPRFPPLSCSACQPCFYRMEWASRAGQVLRILEHPVVFNQVVYVRITCKASCRDSGILRWGSGTCVIKPHR